MVYGFSLKNASILLQIKACILYMTCITLLHNYGKNLDLILSNLLLSSTQAQAQKHTIISILKTVYYTKHACYLKSFR